LSTRVAAIVANDGEPVPAGEIDAFTERMRLDGEVVSSWTDGNAALGNLVRIDEGGDAEAQSSRDRIRVSCDVRLDNRTELERSLSSSSGKPVGRVHELSDELLLLEAYQVWGERMLDWIAGDFAFAVWDAHQRRLFCARDQLGVRPLFYSDSPARLVVGSELKAIAAQQGVSPELDGSALGDFLLFGYFQDTAASVFSSIRRLPPGHALSWERGRLRTYRYWSPELSESRIAPADPEFGSRFEDLLRTTTSEKLRGEDRVTVLMSGGVDSTTVAAIARARHSAESARFVSAQCVDWGPLFADEEPYYAQVAADAVGVPLRIQQPDLERLFDDGVTTTRPAEPWGSIAPHLHIEHLHAAAADAPVALTGFDGDALCEVWLPSHFSALLRAGHVKRFSTEALSLTKATRRPPQLGLRTRLKRATRREGKGAPPMPPWLRRDYVEAFDLRARWTRFWHNEPAVDRHPRADVRSLLTGPIIASMFESFDRAQSARPLDVRHPMLDLRLVNLMLNAPPVPWCVNKEVIRRAAAADLPPVIARRPKTALQGDEVAAAIETGRWPEVDFQASSERFIHPEDIAAPSEAAAHDMHWPLLWARNLEIWLQAE